MIAKKIEKFDDHSEKKQPCMYIYEHNDDY